MLERLTYVGGSVGITGAVGSQLKYPAGFVSTSVGSSVSERITYVGGSVGSAGAVGSQTINARALPWRRVTLGTTQSYSSPGVVPVDRSAKCLRAGLCIPDCIGVFRLEVS